ncbi:ATP-binding protein [Spirochaetota bacterium]
MKNYILNLTSTTHDGGELLDFCEKVLSDNTILPEEYYDILVCLDEAFSNILLHSYKSEGGKKIDVKIKMSNRNELFITFRDYARRPNIREKAPGKEILKRKSPGVGIFIMKKLMDRIIYRRIFNTNYLMLYKKLA